MKKPNWLTLASAKCSLMTVGTSAILLGAIAIAPPPAAIADSCPNAAARVGASAGLPDCRAYEQVSPQMKNGFGMTFEHLIGEGESVQSESLGLFSGATSSVSVLLHHYDSHRGATGWSTSGVEDAPASFAYAGSQNQPVLVNDNEEVLLLLHPASKSVYERNLYLRKPGGSSGSSFTEVGPLLPSSAVPPTPTGSREQGGYGSKQFFATTPDLLHTLFTLQPLAPGSRMPPGVENELWPGDSTVLQPEGRAVVSLYEYVGTGNTTPTLVGVDENGTLLSNCGISPGGSSGNGGPGVAGNHHNAISEDGETVFFTALGSDNTACGPDAGRPPVEEVFARLARSQTVAISQPSAIPAKVAEGECTTSACKANTTVEANFRDANFEGASRNGKKVFFTSTQQLLDGAIEDPSPEDSAHEQAQEPVKGCRTTVGEGGCNLYEYDFSKPEGQRLSLLSGGDTSGMGPNVQGVAALSEDGSHVYFVAKGVLTGEPREGCLAELSPAEKTEEEATSEGRCRPKKEGENLYLRDTTSATTVFVATLSSNANDTEQWSSTGEFPMDVTADGQFLVFTSSALITVGDTGSVTQVFRYDADNGSLVRASIGENGFNNNGNAGSGETLIARGGSLPGEEIAYDQHPAVSEDGTIVVFKSTVALTPGAVEGKCAVEESGFCSQLAQNVYEYRNGQVSLISPGTGASLGIFEGTATVSPSGADIYFVSREPLVAQDSDSLPDIYDARFEGGFPVPAAPASCVGESCQGAAGSPPSQPAPNSSVFVGSGNLLPIPPPPLKKKTAAEVRAEDLAKALKACQKAHRARSTKRKSCEAAARKRFGPKIKAKAKAKAKAKKSGRRV